MEGEVPSRVTVPLELTLAVKERGRAELESLRTSPAMSGKVAAMSSPSGWGLGDCLGAKNLLAAADSVGLLDGSFGGEAEEKAREATAWAEALVCSFEQKERIFFVYIMYSFF